MYGGCNSASPIQPVGEKLPRVAETPQVQKQVSQVKRVEEPMDVSQSVPVLNTGRIQQRIISSDITVSSVRGQSKLFQNVREGSLAYTTFTMLEKFKGLIAASGIETTNRESENVIHQQLKAICDGASPIWKWKPKNNFQTGIKSMQDTQGDG